VGTWGFGAFENDDASGIVEGIKAELEAELVSFVHRVRFGYAIHYDRARAAAVMLTMFAKGGLTWSPPEDATAPLIERTFAAYLRSVPRFDPDHQRAIEADVAELVRMFADPDIIMSPPVVDTVEGALRAIGAEPTVWGWARSFGFDFTEAWKHCASRQTPQVALAVGVDGKHVIGAIAGALLRTAHAIEHSRLDIRADVVDLLETLGANDSPSRTVIERIQEASKVEGAASLKRFRERDPDAPANGDDDDPLLDVLFQVAELTRMRDAMDADGALDPYRAGDLVAKLVRDAKAGDFLATIRANLEPAVLIAAKHRSEALGDEISIPLAWKRNPD
jgi:hypothetical protein